MAFAELSVQEILDLLNLRLGGYANAFDVDEKIRLVNEGKDTVYLVMRQLNEEWFVQSTTTTAGLDNTFGLLSTATREYDLPQNFRELKYVEVLTSGFEHVKFTYRDITHEDFQEQRRQSTINAETGATQRDVYYYTIVGPRKLLLAAFPEANFEAKLWYVRALPDSTSVSDFMDEVLRPYSKNIADWAAKKGVLSLQDQTMTEEWRREWRDAVVDILNTGGRQMSDAQFVIDFLGTSR